MELLLKDFGPFAGSYAIPISPLALVMGERRRRRPSQPVKARP